MADNVTMLWSSEGLVESLSYTVNKVDNADLIFRTFNNNITVSETTVLADLVESSVYTSNIITCQLGDNIHDTG